MTAQKTSYHPPRRKPAHETLEKILVAAEEQLRAEELDAFTIQSVLQRTGLSVGAFYSRFPDKTALLHEVQKRVHARIDAKIMADLSDAQGKSRSLVEAVDKGFGILIAHVLSERQIFRAFMMMSVFDAHMSAKGEQMNWERKRAIAEFLAPHRDQIGHADIESAIDSAYAIYSSTIRGRLVYYHTADERQFGTTEDKLLQDLRLALALFLRGPK